MRCVIFHVAVRNGRKILELKAYFCQNTDKETNKTIVQTELSAVYVN